MHAQAQPIFPLLCNGTQNPFVLFLVIRGNVRYYIFEETKPFGSVDNSELELEWKPRKHWSLQFVSVWFTLVDCMVGRGRVFTTTTRAMVQHKTRRVKRRYIWQQQASVLRHEMPTFPIPKSEKMVKARAAWFGISVSVWPVVFGRRSGNESMR